MGRPRWSGTTTQRGLGSKHQQHGLKLKREMRPGQPCPRCGLPMWPHQKLDRGHTIDRYFGGTDSEGRLEHMHCNRSAGQRLSTQLRMARRFMVTQQRVTASRDW
jgi:hypothetical protein